MSNSDLEVDNYIDVLYRILNASRLDVAKEHAAEALGENVDEFLSPYDDDDYEDLEGF